MPPTLRGKVNLTIPHHFPVDLRRTPLHHAVREPMVGSVSTMQKLRSLLSSLALIALGTLIVSTVVLLIVDAVLGGVL
jgi:hypothetical protein